MYYYLLDPQGLQEAEFERRQTELLGLAHEFNIRGEAGRVSTLRTVKDLVLVAQKREARTLVVCGSDDTFNQTLRVLKNQQFTLGFIPLTPKTQLGELLGLDSIRTAVKTLAARRLALVDTAQVNQLHFFSYLELGMHKADHKTGLFGLFRRLNRVIELKARINEQYIIEASCLGGLIINACGWQTKNQEIGTPTDGWLNMVLAPAAGMFNAWKSRNSLAKNLLDQLPGSSNLPIKSIDLFEPHGLPLTMLGRQVARIPARITIVPSFLEIIVGRDRTF